MRGQAHLSRRTYRKRRQVALAEAAAVTALQGRTTAAVFGPGFAKSATFNRRAVGALSDVSGLDRCVPNVKVEPLALLAKPMNGINAPQRPDCMAVQAVSRDLVSGSRNFPARRERTGKLAEIRPIS
jgi:hypothetical protein